MQRDFEKIYSKLDTFMKDKNVADKDMDSLIKEFINQYNSGTLDVPDTDYDKAAVKFEEALNASSEKKSIKLAKEALKIDPTYVDAKLFLIPFEYTGEDVLAELDKIIEAEEKKLKQEGYFDNVGEFYTMWQTRPYMRALENKAMVLIEYGKMGLARDVLEKMIKLNENDNLGARYILAAVYAYFEDEKSFNKLIKKYKGDNSLSFLASKLCLYYKLGNNKKALEILEEIKEQNSYFTDVISGNIDEDELADFDFGYYQPGEISEVIDFISIAGFLYASSLGLADFIRKYSE